MGDIAAVQQDAGAETCVTLVGRMSEAADYAVVRLDGFTSICFDFEGVSLINSKGVQIWRDFMTKIPGGLAITYMRCPLKVVNQLNLFPTFNGGKSVRIATFYAPYYCGKCDQGRNVLIVADDHKEQLRAGDAPAISCDVCKSPLAFDANPKKFFLFLRRSAANR